MRAHWLALVRRLTCRPCAADGRGAALAALLLACLLPISGQALAQTRAQATAQDDARFFDKLLVLGTGTQGGAFWPIGVSLCDQVNGDRQAQRIRCVAAPTAGSVFNINAVANGRLQLGIAQEDLVLEYTSGRRGPGFEDLRMVATLHQSPVSVVVRQDARIDTLAQIKGLRINLGNRGSGQYTVSTALMQALGLGVQDFASVSYEPTSAFERIFCGGKVDMVVEIVPHPVEVFQKLLACGGRFIEIPADVARKLIAGNPAFRPMAIPANSYAEQSAAVASVGVRNVVVSHARVSAESIARFSRGLAARSAQLRQQQPLLSSMDSVWPERPLPGAGPQQTVLHDGVLRAMPQ